MSSSPKIYPSLLAADFSKLREEIEAVQKAGADGIHFDVMDGHFVPNLSFGAPVLNSIAKYINTDIDCHLMVKNPDDLLEAFAKAGAQRITIHLEVCSHLHRSLQKIKSLGLKAGVSLNPSTPFEALEYVLDELDLILCMTVNPGFGGQKLIPSALDKVEKLKEWLSQKEKQNILIQVDGGIHKHNAQEAFKKGADILVAGSAVFQTPSYEVALSELKKNS